jgi:hypothetical protein
MAMGEAAGRAAGMSVKEGVSPREIVVSGLQRKLLLKRAYLNPAVMI